MRKFFTFLFAALLATAIVSCSKDDDTNTSNNDNKQSSEMGVNELIIDGVVYPMNVTLMGGMNFQATDAGGQRFVINGGIQHTEWGSTFDKTFDLTQPIAGIHCGFSLESESFFYLVFDNTGEKIMGVLDNTEYDGESMFSSGSATIRYNGQSLYIKVNGTLKNGHTFGFIVSVGEQNSEPQPHHQTDRICVGDQQYEYAASLSVTCEGTYLLNVYDPTGNNRFTMIADVEPTSLQNPVNLASSTSSSRYFVRFNSQGLSFSQQRDADNSSANLNGEECASAFSEGGMEFFKSEGEYVLTLSGVLTNGTRFTATVSVSVADIEAMDSQIILNGDPYDCEVTGIQMRGQYTFNASGHDCSGTYSSVDDVAVISLSVIFSPDEIGKTIDLASSTPGSNYMVYASSLDLIGLYFNQSYSSTDGLSACFCRGNENPDQRQTSSIFSKGTLSIDEDDVAITVSVIGTLTDGRSVSSQIRIDKTQIEQY